MIKVGDRVMCISHNAYAVDIHDLGTVVQATSKYHVTVKWDITRVGMHNAEFKDLSVNNCTWIDKEDIEVI